MTVNYYGSKLFYDETAWSSKFEDLIIKGKVFPVGNKALDEHDNIKKFCQAALLSSVDQDDYGFVELDEIYGMKTVRSQPFNPSISNILYLNKNKDDSGKTLSLQEIREWQRKHEEVDLQPAEGVYYSKENPPRFISEKG